MSISYHKKITIENNSDFFVSIAADDKFIPGVYLVKVTAKDGSVYNEKLIIK